MEHGARGGGVYSTICETAVVVTKGIYLNLLLLFQVKYTRFSQDIPTESPSGANEGAELRYFMVLFLFFLKGEK